MVALYFCYFTPSASETKYYLTKGPIVSFYAYLHSPFIKFEDKPSISITSNTLGSTTRRIFFPPLSSTTETPIISTTTNTPHERKPKPSILSQVFKAIDNFINNVIDPPLRPAIDPRHVLSNNFAPVGELPPTECEVTHGSLPPCLDGVYIRNGPNPQYFPQGPHYLFDGDGMLHAIQISQGKATLCSRYIKTYRFVIDREAGYPIAPKVFSNFNILRVAVFVARVLAGHYNLANDTGLANTNLAFFGNRLYALEESDLPYAVKITSDGDIHTIGQEDFDGKLLKNMTAHPKIDPDTREVFAFKYGPIFPFLTYFYFDSSGNKKSDVPIFSMTHPSFLHDFAITKKYAIFVNTQLLMNPVKMIFEGRYPFSPDPLKTSRLGILPRYAKEESEIRWFNMPSFNILHAINAWDEEDDDEVVMIAPNISRVEHSLDDMQLVHTLVEKVRINLKTGVVSRNPISTSNLDFAVINQSFLGKENKYIYAAVGDPWPKISGVVKLDVSKGHSNNMDCTVAKRVFGPMCYGGEPFFVAREPENEKAEEDDGYLVMYVHDEKVGESKFIVMDAKSSNLEIVTSVKLPSRVPYGFHGLFLREMDLKRQLDILQPYIMYNINND